MPFCGEAHLRHVLLYINFMASVLVSCLNEHTADFFCTILVISLGLGNISILLSALHKCELHAGAFIEKT